MKKFIFIALTIIIIVLVGQYSFRVYTKSFSPEAMTTYNENGIKIEVKYCQPSKKNRKIFGELVPYQEIWRTGANEATVFTSNKDLKIENQLLKAGSYSLYSIPTETEWTVIFNTKTDNWGQFGYQKENDVLRVKVKPVPCPMTEVFTIQIGRESEHIMMNLIWDEVKVPVKITEN
jgi:hypothetical protein